METLFDYHVSHPLTVKTHANLIQDISVMRAEEKVLQS